MFIVLDCEKFISWASLYGNRNIFRYFSLSFHEFHVSAFLGLIRELDLRRDGRENVAYNCKLKFVDLFRHYLSLRNFWKLAGLYSETEFKRCSVKARKENSNSRLCVQVPLLHEKWSFPFANFWRTGKKCTGIIKAREGRAKVLLVFIKYAKFVALSLPSRRRS